MEKKLIRVFKKIESYIYLKFNVNYKDAKLTDSGEIGCKIPGSLDISKKLEVIGKSLFKKILVYHNQILKKIQII